MSKQGVALIPSYRVSCLGSQRQGILRSAWQVRERRRRGARGLGEMSLFLHLNSWTKKRLSKSSQIAVALTSKVPSSMVRSETAGELKDQLGRCRRQRHRRTLKKATKSTVASLLHMEGKVTPRAIAYAATLVWSSVSLIVLWLIICAYSLSLTCTMLRSGLTHTTTSASDRFTTLSSTSSNLTALVATSRMLIFFCNGGTGTCHAMTILIAFSRQVFPDHCAMVTKSQKSRKKLLEQRQARSQ